MADKKHILDGMKIATIDDVCRALVTIDKDMTETGDLANTSRLLTAITLTKHNLTFSDVEMYYRKLDCNTYLVAGPLDSVPKGCSVYHPKHDGLLKYVVWIASSESQAFYGEIAYH